MSGIRGRGNKGTELALMKLFRAAKIVGWRRHIPIAGRPDFAFPKQRVVVFVDGCFWHGCQTHYRRPASNRKYWDAKIARNMKRDRLARAELRRKGWKVVRVWEHELKRVPARAVAKISRALNASAIK